MELLSWKYFIEKLYKKNHMDKFYGKSYGNYI